MNGFDVFFLLVAASILINNSLHVSAEEILSAGERGKHTFCQLPGLHGLYYGGLMTRQPLQKYQRLPMNAARQPANVASEFPGVRSLAMMLERQLGTWVLTCDHNFTQ